MAGLYIHIPFCSRKCHYCNFFSVASIRMRKGFTGALVKELEMQKGYSEGEAFTSVYFGGGTPSLLSAGELEAILRGVADHLDVAGDAEITLEANPEDVTPQKAAEWKHLGVNRVSLGVQSFREQDLVLLNRAHTLTEVYGAINALRMTGLRNLSIDLIYGIPGLSHHEWKAGLQKFLSTGIPHLSAYALTVEPGTALDHFIRKGRVKAPTDSHAAGQFGILMETMEAHGFEHYEISNFAAGGHFSRHNMIYWTGGKYLGAGPSAHSYNLVERRWNISSVTEYITSLNRGILPAESETLTLTQKYNEYVMTSLRTSTGASESAILNRFGEACLAHFLKGSADPVVRGNAVFEGENLILTRQG
ncbi:MAG: radical SAM family heme chaperone HemW, partial [Bacteroidales bacterium]|nr:radical SAM family heme chaperone HemW [Bacteroidales bacterium]